MPLENRPRVVATKPLTPALSANLRSRPAVAPRLAASTPPSPAAGLQRAFRAPTVSPEKSEEERALSLNSNVTPRSGARTVRLGTESPTTIATPKDELRNGNATSGLGISSPSDRPSSTSSSRLVNQLITPAPRRISGASNVSQANSDTKFFHANDVRTPPTGPRPINLRPKAPTFVRAASPRTSPKRNPDSNDKFFRADEISNQPATKVTRPLLQTKGSSTSLVNQRPKAGVSRDIALSPTAAKASPLSKPRSSSNARPPANAVDRRRSSSLNTAPISSTTRAEHRKSLSASTITIGPAESHEQPISQTQTLPQPATTTVKEPSPETILAIANSLKHLTNSVSPESSSPRSTSLNSANTAGTSITTNTDGAQEPKPSLPTTRHVRGISEAQGSLNPVSHAQLEAAANARRERKVLDLEISNSSLLAINKTLEKELKKQNAELRRFRRLSRSGRLSLAPANRTVSGMSTTTLGTLAENDFEQSHLSLSEDESDAEKTEDEEDDSYFSDENSSTGNSSEKVRKRARDERRLMQDLTRHQEMLVESQKLTQIIHRCINCTDELIKDGNKALAYRVGIGDVKLGGRVLSQDDGTTDDSDSEADEPVFRQGLLSPVVPKSSVDEATMWIAGLQELDQGRQPFPQLDYDLDQNSLPRSPAPPLTLDG